MYRRRLITGCLRHPLRRASGRRSQRDTQMLRFKIPDHRIDRCGFSGSRPSRQYKNTVRGSLRHRLALKIVKNNPVGLLDPADPLIYRLFVLTDMEIQILKHSCAVEFCQVRSLRIYSRVRISVLILKDQGLYFFVESKVHQIPVDITGICSQKFSGSLHQDLLRKVNMALRASLIECVQDSAPDPVF